MSTTTETKYSVAKTLVECYKLRSDVPGKWCDITIDAGLRSGMISISCDYGKWGNNWGSFGTDFKEFLCELDMEYLAKKFGEDKEFDLKGTCATWLHYAKENYEGEELLDISQEISQCEYSCNTQEDIVSRLVHLNRGDRIMKMYEGIPPIAQRVSRRFQSFYNEMWPVFISEIKKEIAERTSNA